MHLYTYVSILAVLIATTILYIIFRQNNLKDCRYHIGLLGSAVIALIASLFLPKIVSVISVDWALQFVLAFFIALLAYITLIFIVMMLVAAVFPKEKSDKIVEKWENWKISRKEKKAERQQKPDKESKSDTEAADSLKQQEPVLKNIFIKRFSLKKANDINDAEEPEESNLQETPAEETAVFIPESLESLENEPEVFTDTANDEIITDQAQEVQTEGSDEAGKEREPETIPYDEQEPETMTYEEREPETMPYDEQEPEIVPYEEQETETVLYEGPETEEKQETESDMELPDGAVYSDQHEDSQGFLYEKEENTEKNVDTSDIIDKMGLDTISDFIELSSDRLSIDEVLNRAFLLKQEGKELEAASLFINALDMKPDTEVAFWIVLDICVIYKNFGQSELAADILQAYMNEYNDLMSDEVKEQILQSLYF
jgi:tetratricopeptide (TPR) repeat protein